MSRLTGGVIVALACALVASGASIAGIDAWKIVLAGAGFLLFTSGRTRNARKPE
jgi:hypothetical protein